MTSGVRISCPGCGAYLGGMSGDGTPDPEICRCPVCELRSPVTPQTLWRDLCEQHFGRARMQLSLTAGLGKDSLVSVVEAMRAQEAKACRSN